MASGLRFIVLLCLTSGLWTGTNVAACSQVAAGNNDECCKRCPEGWTQFGDYCYKFDFSAKDWADAEAACIAIGGNLASILTKDHYNFVIGMIRSATGTDTRTWVGGHDAVKEGVWLWSDGSKFDFPFWGPGQPDNQGGREHCLELNYQGKANDDPCTVKKSYVCRRDL